VERAGKGRGSVEAVLAAVRMEDFSVERGPLESWCHGLVHGLRGSRGRSYWRLTMLSARLTGPSTHLGGSGSLFLCAAGRSVGPGIVMIAGRLGWRHDQGGRAGRQGKAEQGKEEEKSGNCETMTFEYRGWYVIRGRHCNRTAVAVTFSGARRARDFAVRQAM
jgi:hypothetical protein